MTEVQLVTPTVDLIAYTVPTQFALDMLGYDENQPHPVQIAPEFGGRACYQSWSKPNPETATNASYLAKIQSQRHYSVLEHSQVTLYLQGVSRSFTHELVRHRHAGYSQLSQRYVDSTDVAFVLPPAYYEDGEAISRFKLDMAYALEAYGWNQKHQMAKGLTKKQARESARSVLPNATETKVVVSGNLRAWMEILVKRDNPAADAEMQRVAKLVGDELVEVAPDIFDHEVRLLWDTEFAQRESRA